MTWAHYLLQVNIYLVIFYAFYRLLLDKETYFTLNRIYLLTAGLLSLVIPFIQPEWFMKQTAAPQIGIGIGQLKLMMAQVSIAPGETVSFNWGRLLASIYLTGTVYFSLRLIWRLFKVRQLVKLKPQGAAFSFFNTKVIDHTLPGLETINQHEEIHIRQLHSLDVVFYEMLGILVWCNPVIYAYQMAVKNIHEYLADEAAARFQGDKEAYALLLLSKAFGVDQNILTNSFFNKSLLKNRILMLHKQPSKKAAVLKYGLFLPLFALMLLFSSATISRNEELIEVSAKIAAPESIQRLQSTTINGINPGKQVNTAQGPVHSFVLLDNPPSFPGGMNEFYKYLAKNIKYPKAAIDKNIQGKVFMSFIVEATGELSEVTVDKGPGYGLNEEAARVLKASPKWIPGRNKQGKVRVKYSMPISFTLDKSKPAKKIS